MEKSKKLFAFEFEVVVDRFWSQMKGNENWQAFQKGQKNLENVFSLESKSQSKDLPRRNRIMKSI